MDFDAVIIGGGVVGLACAQRLSAAGQAVLLIERHGSFGQETSSRNSEVIHAGMYYATGTLKARLCVRGNELLYGWCEKWGVRHQRIGKYIIATSAEEEGQLADILKRARANEVGALSFASLAVLRRDEPRVRATAALWSPNTGIIDSHAFMASLLRSAQGAGCDVAWRHTLTAVEPVAGGYRLQVLGPDGDSLEILTRRVVNSAGLACDEVAALAGLDVDAAGYRLKYVKGNYFRVRGRDLAHHLIYPVPPAGLAGLGVHITLDLDGGVRLGPDVEVLPRRELNYGVSEELTPRFLAAVSRYLDGVTLDDLTPDQSGIRPKLTPAGGGIPDFIIAEESARGLPGWVNLVGIESPGLTASLPLADSVAELLA